MKKSILLAMVGCICFPVSTFAESYYCTPKGDGKYICEPAGEIRSYPNGKQSASSWDGFRDKFRCQKDGGMWVCVPFEEGAIILEPEHKCPEPYGQGRIWLNPT